MIFIRDGLYKILAPWTKGMRLDSLLFNDYDVFTYTIHLLVALLYVLKPDTFTGMVKLCNDGDGLPYRGGRG